MTSAKVISSDGKDEEAECKDAFDLFNGLDKNFTYHRYPDTRSASRGKVVHAIASQPSDFIIAYQRYHVRTDGFGDTKPVRSVWHVETKATIHKRLKLDSLRQYGMLKKFWWAGVEPIVPVHLIAEDAWVALLAYRLFPGQSPFEYNDDKTPASFDFEGLFRYKSAEALLRDVFNFRKVKQ